MKPPQAFERAQIKYFETLSSEQKLVLEAYLNSTLASGSDFFLTLQLYLRGQSAGESYETNQRRLQDFVSTSQARKLGVHSSQDFVKVINIFDSIFDNAPALPNDLTVYRGVSFRFFLQKNLFQANAGQSVIDEGYLSTTYNFDQEFLEGFGLDDYAFLPNELVNQVQELDLYKEVTKIGDLNPNITKVYLNEKCCFMEIVIPKGTRVLAPYLYPGNHNTQENEILCKRGANLIFEKRIRKNGASGFKFRLHSNSRVSPSISKVSRTKKSVEKNSTKVKTKPVTKNVRKQVVRQVVRKQVVTKKNPTKKREPPKRTKKPTNKRTSKKRRTS